MFKKGLILLLLGAGPTVFGAVLSLDEKPPTAEKALKANMDFLMRALQKKDVDSVFYMSEGALAETVLHGRDGHGGNLFHYVARNTDLSPNLVRKVFLGEMRSYKTKSEYANPGGYETRYNQTTVGITDRLPVSVIGEALKFRNHNGLTPTELARRHENKPALKILFQMEEKYNTKISDRALGFGMGSLAISSASIITALSGGPTELIAGISAIGVASACYAVFLSAKKLP